MLIQVNTDHNISGFEAMTAQVRQTVEHALGHHDASINRVEVFLSDQNSDQKDGANDMRCVMEARLSGRQPVAVTDNATTLHQAVDGAAVKLERLIANTLGRLQAVNEAGRSQ